LADAAIIVFSRLPVDGAVKTRLFKLLKPEAACQLHEACLADTLALANKLTHCRRWLYVTGRLRPGRRAPSIARGLSIHWRIQRQRGGNLGARMRNALADCFQAGCSKAVLIGTDTPWTGAARLRESLRALNKADVVLGPAQDGGYYLVGARRGMRAEPPDIFAGIEWGTRHVLRQTVQKLRHARIPFRMLPRDFDLDRPADLVRAEKLLGHAPRRSPRLASWLKAWRAARP
jgi:rSAM/selenodomain-associated transferase 1